VTQTYYPGREFVQEYMPDQIQHRKQIADALNNTIKGRLNGTMSVTLDALVSTTTIYDARISLSTVPIFSPATANAAAEIAAGGLYFALNAGECVAHHANNSQTDRTFQVVLIG